MDRPDFLILLLDQARRPRHWPAGWVERHLPAFARLARHGLTFESAWTAASMCSPSRACLLTGEYAPRHGVARVGDELPRGFPNVATMLRAVGYEVVYKGKWHLSQAVRGGHDWSEEDVDHLLEAYGFSGWNPPDAGTRAGARDGGDREALATLGGGRADNDGRCVRGGGGEGQTPGWGEGVLAWVARQAATPAAERRPFCLFVSLTNPHDICFFPEGTHLCPSGYQDLLPDLGLAAPPNGGAGLQGKPSVQARFRDALGLPADDEVLPVALANFYAWLHVEVDRLLGEVLDAFDEHGLTEDTVILLTSDHGEMALSHGLLGKAYNAYEETVGVPLLVSNPRLFPEARTTRAPWSHVDLPATLAELAGAEPIGVGVSQVPVLLDPETPVRRQAVFAFDDSFGLPPATPASHLRALLDGRHTYAVYFTPFAGEPFEFELYDREADPLQEVNLLSGGLSAEIQATWSDLHERLTAELAATAAFPPGFAWPEAVGDLGRS